MPETLAVNTERNFKVQVRPCLITKEFDRCIVVNFGSIAVEQPDGTMKYAQVEGAFSRDGLQSLLADLEAVPDPLGLPTADEIRAAEVYQWAVVMEDGEHYQQWPPGEREKPFSEIHLPEVSQFWIIPRFDPDSLPWYGLIRGKGFVVRNGPEGGDASLDLPHPGETPFWFQYYRKVVQTMNLALGQSYRLPAHTVQVLGWRVGETIFEIGIESDGNWQVWKRQPLENPPLW